MVLEPKNKEIIYNFQCYSLTSFPKKKQLEPLQNVLEGSRMLPIKE